MQNFRYESLKIISALILFVYKLIIGSFKNHTEHYPRKCFWTQEKETRVKFIPGLSAYRPSNNWAQVNSGRSRRSDKIWPQVASADQPSTNWAKLPVISLLWSFWCDFILSLCTDVPSSLRKKSGGLLSRFFLEGGGDVCTKAILSFILYFYISMYTFLSFFLNIDLWKTCKIALAKCFSHVK